MQRNVRSTLLVVVCVVATLGVAWICRPDGSPSTPRAAASATTRTNAEPPGGASAVTWSGDVDPAGALRLEGQVLDGDDAPVGGATVAIDTQPRRTVTTEEDGSFVVEGLLPRRYAVSATAREGVAGPVAVRVDAITDPLVLRLRPPGVVEVTVVDAHSLAPVRGASVEVRAPVAVRAITGDDGVAVVTPVLRGHWNVTARADGLQRAHGSVVVGDQPAALTLTLDRGFAIRGRVVDERGAAIPGARVWPRASSDWTYPASPEHDGVDAADDGSFGLDGLGAGTYRVEARARGYAPGTSSDVTVGTDAAGETSIVLARAATLRGRVAYADGRPAPGAIVRAFLTSSTVTTHTRDDGSFELAELPREEVYVLAEARDASCWAVAADLTGGAATVNLRLDLDGAISGVVVDSAGDPIESAQVELALVRTGARFVRSDATDGAGAFRFTGLPDGAFEITASRPGVAPAPRDVPVRAGVGDAVRIVLRAPGSLAADVEFRDGGTPSLVSARLSARGDARTFTDGRIRIGALAPGTYELRLEGPELASPDPIRVEVDEGQTSDLGTIRVDRGRTVDGVVVDADGVAVAGAEIVAATVLVGTGSAVDSGARGPAFQGELRRARSAGDGTFTLRGLPATPLVAVATHPSRGRSSAVPLGPGDEGPVRLALAPTAAIAGTVTRDGRPVTAVVAAQPHDAPLAMSVVLAGGDGRFRFDRVPAGRLSVFAAAGDPLSGWPFAPVAVEVASGGTTTVEIPAVVGSRSIEVTTRARSVVFVTTEHVDPTTAFELVTALGRQVTGHWAMSPAPHGSARFSRLASTDYTACAVRIDEEITDIAEMLAIVSRRGASMRVTCRPVPAGSATASLPEPS